MTDWPKEIVKDFKTEIFFGDINRLKDFCFADLKGPALKKCKILFSIQGD